jgi:hypothetical protein
MAEPMDSSEQAALWRRWRRAASAWGGAAGPEPDELMLAAYAEDRLSPAEIEAVEDWLALNPHAAEDIVAARRLSGAALPPATDAVVARATALVGGGAAILPFRQGAAAQPRWRRTAAWGAVAASIVAASLVGFATGNSTYMTLAGGSTPSLGQELLDPPTGLFNAADEDSNI